MLIARKETALVLARLKGKRLYLGVLAALLAAGVAAVIPYLYGRLTDLAISSPGAVREMVLLILVWLLLSFLNQGLARFSNRQAYIASTDLTNGLVVDLFHHLVMLPVRFHKEQKMGQVMRRADRGIDALGEFIERTVFSFFPAIVSFIVALGILLTVEWRLAGILVVASVFYVLITVRYTKGIVMRQKLMHRRWERAYGDLWESVNNVQTVKASTAEDFERRRNAVNFRRAGEFYKQWRRFWQNMEFWQASVFTVSFIGVFGFGVALLRMGALSPGELIMFVGYTSLLTGPLARLADQYRDLHSGITAFRRAAGYFDLDVETDVPDAVALKEVRGEVAFEGVNFGYQKGRRVLKDISFRAAAGDIVALVGESGVGKSTLVDLIGRYYAPTAGKIFLDGTDIQKVGLKSLRALMAVVPQEVLLFNETVKNNIRYGRPSASDAEVETAARAANASEFIEGFPKKYEQLVGERGIKLSVGQKQRIAIARALLRDPRILVLDEATSALDSVSERLVQEALKKLVAGRTTFVIAHRLSTIQHADLILVLEKGRIVEQGTHRELMRRADGVYRNFWELQSAIKKIE
ncbi:MAG: ABC transporter ATP-binding protein [Candidatus Jorgensenbacteria bacterium]